MALEGTGPRPQLRYVREGVEATDPIVRALELAQHVEALLEETPSNPAAVCSESRSDPRSTRMVRAMAASLVNELEALVRGTRQSGAA